MIHTNLSTRPFYNARAVKALLTVFAVIVLAATAYNLVEILRLSSSQRTLGAKASAAEEESARLHSLAVQALARVDPKELAVVDKAAREANSIIDQRTFSWTDLFAHFEKTLPPEVRITSVQQQAGSGVVLIGAESRDIDDIDQFIEALEKTGAFSNVSPRTETLMEDDTFNATLEATYTPQPRSVEGQP